MEVDLAQFIISQINKENKGISSFVFLIIAIFVSNLGKIFSSFIDGLKPKAQDIGEIIGEKIKNWLKKK